MTKSRTPVTARGYFRALIEKTNASAVAMVYHLRSLREIAELDTDKVTRLLYAGFNTERGLERL